MRKARKRRFHGYLSWPCIGFTVIAAPPSGRQYNAARGSAFLQDRRDKQILSHHELIDYSGIALSGIVIFKTAENRLAVFPSLLRERCEFRRKFLAQRNDIREYLLILRVKHAPRRSGNLHHRTKRVDLRGADEKLGIKRRTGNERNPVTAAHHVRTDERMTEKTRRDHIGDDSVERAPFVHLVVKTHNNGLELKAPCVADFAERIFHRIIAVAIVQRAARRFRIMGLAV